ncbi:TPA: hypothetical protein CPT92_04815 [Candidatus Gastranaerophilales bacterium HUM_13]|jgi:hypothetical protein|nr:MAG TPA: hypothetical protein CPT92_04815 [Candidatus Gastranaerophilales bacterium HUM_13]
MTNMELFNIITGIAGVCGALSWIPILIDKCKLRKIRTSLIHCRFFDKFFFPILPPDYIRQHLLNPDIKFDKLEGTLIVIGVNICSTNKDFVVDKINAKLTLDKSEHEAILVSPDVVVPYYSTQDNVVKARLYIPSNIDISKMKNIKADINTRLYMAFICKDVNEMKYTDFRKLEIELIDIDNKLYKMNFDKKVIDNSSLIIDRDIYDVDYAAKNANRQLYETLCAPTSNINMVNEKEIGENNG